MSKKTDYTIQGAPIDLMGLSRFQLAFFLCSLDHAAQHEVLRELEELGGKEV